MDMRDREMRMDGRNPYGSRGGYVVSSRGRGRRSGRRGDRAMGYEREMAHQNDMRSDYARQGGMDGHHYPQGQMGGYQPVEFMGYCNGYYGTPEQDYARSGRYGYDMRYDMRGGMGRDYGYDYDDYGDYGETLSDEELEHFNKRLLSQLSDQEKQMLSKEAVMQRAKALNRPMENFGEKELYTATLMWYTDNKEFFGQNVDFAVKGGYAFLADKDVKVKGAEKLAVYYDEIVMGGEQE